MTAFLSRARPARSALRSIAVLIAAVVIAACGDSTGPSPRAHVAFVRGNGQSDTVEADLLQALVVEVRDSSGAVVPGKEVLFKAVYPGNGSVPELLVTPLEARLVTGGFIDTTDANGRAAAIVRLGTIAGAARLAVSAPALHLEDTARFEVLPGKTAQIRISLRDTATDVGGQYTLKATAADRWGNLRSHDAVQLSSRNGHAMIDAAGKVTAASVGRAWLIAQSGGVIDSAGLSVVPQGKLVVAELGQDASGYTVGYVSTIGIDGKGDQHLTPVTSNVLMPTSNRAGTAVAFYEGNPASGARVYLVTGAGRVPLLATRPAGLASDFRPSFSPDGQWVYFAGYSTSVAAYALWRAHADGTGAEEVVPAAPYTSNWQASASPDGVHVVFTSGSSLAVLDLNTRQVTPLGVTGSNPQYSPDGTKILYLAGGTLLSLPLSVMNADGTGIHVVPTTHGYDEYTSPHWSPDGKWIVIRGPIWLELVNAQTGELLPLPYSANLYQPAFEP